jgi:hypothetical protein
MQQSSTRLLSLLGTVAWGDLGPLTLYRSTRGRIVVYAKTWPEKPPSPWQASQRERFRLAAHFWRTWASPLKPNWERAARRLSLSVTGFDLWMYYSLRADRAAIATIEHQSGLQLLPLVSPSSSSSSSST